MCQCDEGFICAYHAKRCSICEGEREPGSSLRLCAKCKATARAAGRYLADWMRCDAPRR